MKSHFLRNEISEKCILKKCRLQYMTHGHILLRSLYVLCEIFCDLSVLLACILLYIDYIIIDFQKLTIKDYLNYCNKVMKKNAFELLKQTFGKKKKNLLTRFKFM